MYEIAKYCFKSQRNKLFIAGGISNCPNWQMELVKMLYDDEKNDIRVIFNPRQYKIAPDSTTFAFNLPLGLFEDKFDPTDVDKLKEQVQWEYKKLREADVISFWFPKETICPMTLFELGVWISQSKTRIFVGIDPEYQRKDVVEMQLQLEKPDIKVVYSLKALAEQLAAAYPVDE
jgi:hypothetical protein